MASDSMKDDSPFPSGPEMDLDMWRAGARGLRLGRIIINTSDSTTVAQVPADDATARRIEMLGDLYEGLRRAAEKMAEAGMDVGEEHAILAEFVTPKPFPEGQ